MWYDLIVYTPMYVTAFWAAVFLLSPIKKNRAKHFLGLFMVVAFLLYLSHTLFFKQEFGAYLVMDPVYTFASLAVYPMYYWYIRLLTVEPTLKYQNLLLLLPAFMVSVATLLVYVLMGEAEKMDYLQHFLLHRKPVSELSSLARTQGIIFIIGRIVFAATVVYSLVFGRKLVIQYNKKVANFYSNLEDKTIVWVKYLLYSFVATSLMSFIFNVIGRSVFIEFSGWLLVPSLIFSVLLFFIGFQGYIQNYSVVELVEDEQKVPAHGLSFSNSAQLKNEVVQLFENEKIYRDPNLKITHICNRLKTNRTYISKLINNEFNSTFSEFVNSYRIREAKMLLEDPPQKFSLNHVSEAAGFGSLSSFIRIFKEKVGVTPGRYREDRKN
ncbi:MAG: helix-turn-helix transcriptional regulator [Bacteroidota bacterium]